MSLTSIVCKLFERILKKALLYFLSETWSISPRQHGLLLRRSCLSNLLVFEDAVARMMDEIHTVDVIYLDFAKAFDSINQRFFLVKMMLFGLGDVVVRWIEAYRSGRVSREQVGRERSGTIPMHSGVPQGSVISPLLFLLFVNDLPDIPEAMTLLFADDVRMVARMTQNMNLYRFLTAACDWSQKWDLPINPTKCNCRTIGREATLKLSFFPDWSGNTIPVSKLAILRPHLEFRSPDCSPNRVADINHLERIQRLATRLVTGMRHLPYEERLHRLGLHVAATTSC